MTDENADDEGQWLIERLQRGGAISVARFMALCLSDPEFGYYRRRQAIGAGGDFITAPEISQIFGELVGVWCAAVWRAMGAPGELRLVEIGPGRGTMMGDCLRAFRHVPGLSDATHIHLIEISEALRAEQETALRDVEPPVSWHRDWDIPPGPTIIVANEVLDALPVAQFVLTDDGWRERMVCLDREGRLSFASGDAAMASAVPDDLRRSAKPGDIFERRNFADLLAPLARRADGPPLAALFIDYGHARSSLGETLQAVAAHRFADPLGRPGACDLTAQVDFADFIAAAGRSGLTTFGPLSQGAFLAALGIRQRLEQLCRRAEARQIVELEAGVHRLASPDAMGERFKVVAIQSPGLAPPPPFG